MKLIFTLRSRIVVSYHRDRGEMDSRRKEAQGAFGVLTMICFLTWYRLLLCVQCLKIH